MTVQFGITSGTSITIAGVTVNSWGQTQDFTINQYPANPIAGEVVMLWVTGLTGFSVVTDIYREVDFQTDFGAGATGYTVGTTGQGNRYAPGWTVSFTTLTPGDVEVTITGRTFLGTPVAKSHTITFTDPDAVSWDDDLYVSFADDFSGFPSETGAVQHISTHASLVSTMAGLGTGREVRVTFRDDEVYTMGTSAVSLGKADSNYYMTRSFAGTDNPKFEPGGTPTTPQFSLFNGGNNGGNSITCVGLDADGKYDPSTGLAPNGLVRFLSNAVDGSTTQGSSISMAFGEYNGLVEAYLCDGGGWDDLTNHARVYDCKITNFQNYGIGRFGGSAYACYQGVKARQSPTPLRIDGKGATLPPTGPDHTAIRTQMHRGLGIVHCDLAVTSGWPTGGVEYAVQPCIRVHTFEGDQVADAVVSICGNVAAGDKSFLNYGGQSSSKKIEVPHHVLVTQNLFLGGGQATEGFVKVDASGLRMWNNVFYQSDILDDTSASNARNRGLTISDGESESSARSGVTYVGFNSFINARTTAGSGATGNDFDLVEDSGWTGTAVTTESNIVELSSDLNDGDFTDYGPLSPGDNFKPSTGSAAIDAISSGWVPVRDYDGNLRTQTTNVGAHHDDVASVDTPADPANTVAPTIAELSGFPDNYAISDLGTWTGVDGLLGYLIERKWAIDDALPSSDSRHAARTYYDDDGSDSGSLTMTVTRTNLSGTRVSAESSGIDI